MFAALTLALIYVLGLLLSGRAIANRHPEAWPGVLYLVIWPLYWPIALSIDAVHWIVQRMRAAAEARRG